MISEEQETVEEKSKRISRIVAISAIIFFILLLVSWLALLKFDPLRLYDIAIFRDIDKLVWFIYLLVTGVFYFVLGLFIRFVIFKPYLLRKILKIEDN